MKYALSLLLSCLLIITPVQAADVYRSRDNMPMVELMLLMMEAMGIIDKIPQNYASNGFGGSSGYMNYLSQMRYLQQLQALQNLYGGNMMMPGSPMTGMLPGAGFGGMGNALPGSPMAGMMPGLPFNGMGNPGVMLPGMAANLPAQGWPGAGFALPDDPALTPQVPNPFARSPAASAATSSSGNVSGGPLADPESTIPGYFSSGDDRLAILTEAARRAQSEGTGSAVKGAVDTVEIDGVWRNGSHEVLMISQGKFIWKNTLKNQSLVGYMHVIGNKLIATLPTADKPMVFHYAIQGNRMNIYSPDTGQTLNFHRSGS